MTTPTTAKQVPTLDDNLTVTDEHAFVAAQRARAPLFRGPLGIYVLLTHRHTLQVMEEGCTRQLETEALLLRGIESGPLFEFYDSAMLFANGQSHVNRRAPVTRTFAYKLMDGMRGQITALTEDLVTARLDAVATDFLKDIASQIPARMIARILGVPETDLPRFTELVYGTARGIGFFPLEDRAQIEEHTAALMAYVEDLLNRRRADPQEDFLTDYVRSVDDDQILDAREIRTQIGGVILAGSDTTRLALCSILSQLLRHPDQWEAFCADPDGLKKQVVEEGLRYDPVVGSIPRVALRDIDIDGYTIPAGQVVAPSILAALRDPAVYHEPDRFNIFRTDHPRWSLAFGFGAHRCLGEALARAELEEALAVIARMAPGTRIIGPPPKLSGVGGIRTIDGMTVSFRG